MDTISKISKWQALFRNFEGAVRDFENVSVITESIDSTKEFSNSQMAQSLAREIGRFVQEQNSHFQFKRERAATVSRPEVKYEEKDISDEDYDDIEAQLEQIIGGPTETLDKSEVENYTFEPVDASQIDLCEITEDSKVQTRVFPLSFWCNSCGHYEIIDPRTKKSLKCPCCKTYCKSCDKKFENLTDSKCPECGSKLITKELEQFSYVFACPRCGSLEEFTPRLARIEDVRGALIPCPDCKTGHLHFFMKESFQTVFWRCSIPDCDFNKRPFNDRKLDKFCKCHIRKGPNNEEGRPSIMKPTPTSATSIAYPLTRSYLYMGTSHVTLENLEQMHEQTKGADIHQWKLSENVPEIDMKMISEIYGIEDVFTVPKILTITAVYGYKSGVSSHPVTIPDGERLAKLFKHGRKYRVYVVRTEGRGLVIKLDKNRLLKLLHSKLGYNETKSYKEIVDSEISYLMESDFQHIIDNPEHARLISLLHALEHTFLKCAMNQIGLEAFGSKILIEDCAIVLYEREEVGSGGLTQLTLGTGGIEFKKYLREIEKQIEECPQLCNDACPACVYINDFFCQPFMPNEVERWFPPNSLLNRIYANQFLKLRELTKINKSKGEKSK